MPEVLSAYQITGSFDYILTVIVKNQGDLSRFLMEKLTPFECVARIETHQLDALPGKYVGNMYSKVQDASEDRTASPTRRFQ